MQLLPDGKVRIQNSQTGEVKDIDPIELPKYNPGLVAEYQKLKTPAPVTSTMPAQIQSNPEQVVKKSFSERLGQGVIDIGKHMAAPFVRTGKNVYGAAEETLRSKLLKEEEKQADKSVKQQMDLIKKIKEEKDPIKKKALLEQSRNVGAKQENISQGLDTTTQARGVLNDQDLNTLDQDPRSAVVQQLKDSTNIASYAVPFGKGTGVITKATLPGATVGAMQALSEKEVTPGKVVGGAVMGAALPTLFYGLSKFKAGLSGKGQAVEKAGENVKHSIRQINLPGKVGGAQKETMINRVLDQLGIKGTPQQQYEMLQPKMTELETTLRSSLETNSKTFKPQDVQDEILKVLDDQGFLVGAKNKTKASAAIKDVMKDVINKSKDKQLTSIELFNVKQKLNSMAQRISEKMDKGIAVKPEDEVLMAAREALDDVIGKYHPDVKDMTVAQSYLFDAAKKLASARFNPPVLRGPTGFTIPSTVTIKGKEAVGGALEKAGQGMQGVSSILPDITGNVAGQIESRIPSAIQSLPQDANQPQNTLNNQSSNQQSNNQLNASQDHSSIIPPSTTELPSIPQTLNPYGATPEIIYREYQNALDAGDSKTADRLKTMYNDEVAYQKTNKGKAEKTAGLDATIDSMKALYGSGDKALSQSSTTGLSGAAAKVGTETKKAFSQEYADRLTQYKQMAALAAGIINQARGAGTLNAGEFEILMQNIPNEYTSTTAANAWFTNAKKILKEANARTTPTAEDLLPDIAQ